MFSVCVERVPAANLTKPKTCSGVLASLDRSPDDVADETRQRDRSPLDESLSRVSLDRSPYAFLEFLPYGSSSGSPPERKSACFTFKFNRFPVAELLITMNFIFGKEKFDSIYS